MRRSILMAAALLASCALASCAPVARDALVAVAAGQPAVCRIGPDGGPPSPARWADRGIGGTGAASTAAWMADRGIGGTGIVGVVTGFASVCLAGHEVRFDDAVQVQVDGDPASPADLRVGQLAAVQAAGPNAALRALGIAVRHEVSGPVEAVDADGALRVAGQRVVVSQQTWAVPGAAAMPRPGEWVAVSGLREPDDTIHATRLDRRPPGAALVRGTLLDDGGRLHIGALEVRPVPGRDAASGRSVTASGRYEDGALLADTLAEDVLAEDPPAYFGRAVRAFVLEGYAIAGNSRLRLGRGLDVAASAGIGPFASRRVVVELNRGRNGTLRATALRDFGAAARGPQPDSLLRPGSQLQPGPGGGAWQFGPSGNAAPAYGGAGPASNGGPFNAEPGQPNSGAGSGTFEDGPAGGPGTLGGARGGPAGGPGNPAGERGEPGSRGGPGPHGGFGPHGGLGH